MDSDTEKFVLSVSGCFDPDRTTSTEPTNSVRRPTLIGSVIDGDKIKQAEPSTRLGGASTNNVVSYLVELLNVRHRDNAISLLPRPLPHL
jgi:hypothetical protein